MDYGQSFNQGGTNDFGAPGLPGVMGHTHIQRDIFKK